jgi:hypothetical protein
MLFEYPVYVDDIKGKGFRAVSLGVALSGRDGRGLAQVPQETLEKAADEAVELLTDRRLRRETVDHNFRLAREHYSLDSLRDHFKRVIG